MLQPSQHTCILATTWAVDPAVHNAAWSRDPSALLDKPSASQLTVLGLLVLGHSTAFASAILGTCAIQHCTTPTCLELLQRSLSMMHCSMQLWPWLCLYQLVRMAFKPRPIYQLRPESLKLHSLVVRCPISSEALLNIRI